MSTTRTHSPLARGLYATGVACWCVYAQAAEPPAVGESSVSKYNSGRDQTSVFWALEPNPDADAPVLPIDLPTALRLLDPANPTNSATTAAEEAVRDAYQRLLPSRTQWLPSVQAVPMAFHRVDGRLQGFAGQLLDVSTESTDDRTDALPSISSGDTLFGPLFERRRSDARRAVRLEHGKPQLQVALCYFELLSTYAKLEINSDSILQATEMAKQPVNQQARVEVAACERERLELQAQAARTSAELARLLALQPSLDLRPADPLVMPITLVSPDSCVDELVAVAVMTRPELAANRVEAAAAYERWRQARLHPLFPDYQLVGGENLGNLGTLLGHLSPRESVSFRPAWPTAGTEPAHAQTAAEAAPGQIESTQVRVADEVTNAMRVARASVGTLEAGQEAVRQAMATWQRLTESTTVTAANPVPLRAEQALAKARTRYLADVIGYNRAQFQLYDALGRPSRETLPRGTPLPSTAPDKTTASPEHNSGVKLPG